MTTTNFRPISLLSTLYKLFSGCIASQSTTVASDNEWLSPGQKGFFPGVHGIQEHTMLLEGAIEEAGKRSSTICWLDLDNAFDSLPHDYLNQLFCSFPVPPALRSILNEIYQDNEFRFVVDQELVTDKPTSEVRQGDGLSSVIFNLAPDPLVCHTKAKSNAGFHFFNTRLKSTAYSYDISVADSNPISLQSTIDGLIRIASILGLRFYTNKCYSLIFTNGRASTSTNLSINGVHYRSLE